MPAFYLNVTVLTEASCQSLEQYACKNSPMRFVGSFLVDVRFDYLVYIDECLHCLPPNPHFFDLKAFV